MELTDENVSRVLGLPAVLIYSPAEQVLEERFLVALKDPNGKFYQRASAIVIDDSHTVEIWTGKRYLAYV